MSLGHPLTFLINHCYQIFEPIKRKGKINLKPTSPPFSSVIVSSNIHRKRLSKKKKKTQSGELSFPIVLRAHCLSSRATLVLLFLKIQQLQWWWGELNLGCYGHTIKVPTNKAARLLENSHFGICQETISYASH